MPVVTFDCRDEHERPLVERAIAYVTPLRQVAQDAPDGTVVDACERVALADGRNLLRPTLAAAPQSRLAAVGQKGGAARHCPLAPPGRHKGQHPHTVLTAVGPVTVQRCSFACATCGQGDLGADRIPGVDGYVTRGARRMAGLLGVQQSFAKAELALTEVAGWDLDDNAIRQLCHATAADVSARREERCSAERFAAAAGDREPQIDAGKADTLDGWRDVQVAVFGRRERGAPTSAADWDERDLPAPTLAEIEDLLATWQRRPISKRKGIPLSVEKELRQQGMAIKAIAAEVGLHRATVRTYRRRRVVVDLT